MFELVPISPLMIIYLLISIGLDTPKSLNDILADKLRIVEFALLAILITFEIYTGAWSKAFVLNFVGVN